MQQLEDVVTQITQLEQEREAIYEDSRVSETEHPRLMTIQHELARLWDLRRRLEAARAAGLDTIPVPQPENPEQLIG